MWFFLHVSVIYLIITVIQIVVLRFICVNFNKNFSYEDNNLYVYSSFNRRSKYIAWNA